MESCSAQAVLPLVGLAADKVIRDQCNSFPGGSRMSMYRMRRLAGMLLAIAVAFGSSDARAQLEMLGAKLGGEQPGQTVAGVGVVTLSRPPDLLRMHVELTGKAETLDEALAQLKTRREAALLQLEMLKADMDSVETEAPRIAAGQSRQQRQMEQMIRERMRSRGQRTPPGLTASESVAVSMTLRAEWPLEAKTPEEVLRRAESIRQQIKEADLAGSEEEEDELSPEARELAEEMAGMSPGYDESAVKEGEPVFLFVARVSDADREKAMAEAFAKAREQARSLARAAGVDLGPLVSLAGHGTGQSDMTGEEYGYEYQAYVRRLAGRSAMSSALDQNASEAMGPSPKSLSFKFLVRAYFALASTE
ncbi:MAG: SIMPL domain-containing protein [Planctomycetota bacterium]